LDTTAKGTEISFAFFSTIQQNYQQSGPKIQGDHIVQDLENLWAKQETQMISIVSKSTSVKGVAYTHHQLTASYDIIIACISLHCMNEAYIRD
jgi:hypothetical protein